MTSCWKNILYFVLNTFLIVRLAMTYKDYKSCVEPIHHWYMGFLVFLFIFRFFIMLIDLPQVHSGIWCLLVFAIGPCTLVFLFSWNIVGTIFMAKILGSSNISKCMSTGTIVFSFIIICIVYGFYLIIFIGIWAIYKSQKNLSKKKTLLTKNLKDIYKKLLEEKTLLSIDAKKLKDKLKDIQLKNKKTLENMEMFEEEREIMRMFFTPVIRNNPQIQKPFISKSDNEQPRHRRSLISDPVRLTGPLLDMMGTSQRQKEIENRISNIQKHSDPHSEDCIVCFSEIDDPMYKISLKCKHFFHTECIFDWLKINPSCPMCRQSFRIQLIEEIISYLDQSIQLNHNIPEEDEVDQSGNLSTPLLKDNNA